MISGIVVGVLGCGPGKQPAPPRQLPACKHAGAPEQPPPPPAQLIFPPPPPPSLPGKVA